MLKTVEPVKQRNSRLQSAQSVLVCVHPRGCSGSSWRAACLGSGHAARLCLQDPARSVAPARFPVRPARRQERGSDLGCAIVELGCSDVWPQMQGQAGVIELAQPQERKHHRPDASGLPRWQGRRRAGPHLPTGTSRDLLHGLSLLLGVHPSDWAYPCFAPVGEGAAWAAASARVVDAVRMRPPVAPLVTVGALRDRIIPSGRLIPGDEDERHRIDITGRAL